VDLKRHWSELIVGLLKPSVVYCGREVKPGFIFYAVCNVDGWERWEREDWEEKKLKVNERSEK